MPITFRSAPPARVGQASNASFDAATFEIWGALLHGGCLVIVPRSETLSAPALQAFLQSSGVDTLFLTTALFNQLARELPNAFSSLRHLIFGGEVADASVVASILASNPPAHLINGYGPTENTTFTTWYEVDEHFNPGVRFPSDGPFPIRKYTFSTARFTRFPWARLANCTRSGWAGLGLSRASGPDGGAVRARSLQRGSRRAPLQNG